MINGSEHILLRKKKRKRKKQKTAVTEFRLHCK